jgi:hypothetical protein
VLPEVIILHTKSNLLQTLCFTKDALGKERK